MNIALIGVGLIGGSIGLAARERLGATVRGFDTGAGVLDAALRRGALDEGCGSVAETLEGADTAFVAVPVGALARTVDEALGAAGEGCAVSDVGSTKRAVLAGRDDPRFVGGHPLAGAAIGGLEAARPDLFTGRPWLLTCAEASRAGTEDAALRQSIVPFVEGLGARPQLIDADEHDSLVAYLSHLPQLAASALMYIVGERARGEGLALAGRGLSDTTRLASSPADIWRDIAATNPDNLARAIDELIDVLQRLKPPVGGSDQALERTFESAARWKQVLENKRTEG